MEPENHETEHHEPENHEAEKHDVVISAPKTSCRGNINRLHGLCQSLADAVDGKEKPVDKKKKEKVVDGKEKLEICKKSPFYPLMVEKAPKNNIELFDKVAQLFDTTTNAFVLNGRHMTLCVKEISYLMSLPCKMVDFDPKPASVFPKYFTTLCERYGKDLPPNNVSTLFLDDLFRIMEAKTDDDKLDFARVLNMSILHTIAASSQGTISKKYVVFCESLDNFEETNWPRYIHEKILEELQQKQKRKPVVKRYMSVTCMVQFVEAWFNMRTGQVTVERSAESTSAPVIRYLSNSHFSSSDDYGRAFAHIKPNEIRNCSNAECSNRELVLDNGNMTRFTYNCSSFSLNNFRNDYFGSFIKCSLTQWASWMM